MSKTKQTSDNHEQSDLHLGITSGCYYWVKCFKDSEYQPAMAKDRYGNGVMYFCFTNGSVKECKYVIDYKKIKYH